MRQVARVDGAEHGWEQAGCSEAGRSSLSIVDRYRCTHLAQPFSNIASLWAAVRAPRAANRAPDGEPSFEDQTRSALLCYRFVLSSLSLHLSLRLLPSFQRSNSAIRPGFPESAPLARLSFVAARARKNLDDRGKRISPSSLSSSKHPVPYLRTDSAAPFSHSRQTSTSARPLARRRSRRRRNHNGRLRTDGGSKAQDCMYRPGPFPSGRRLIGCV